MSGKCKICEHSVVSHAIAKVRFEYDAHFLKCTRCGFVSVENPFWLPKAYAEPINPSDTGYMSRNLWCRDRVRMCIELFLNPSSTFLDYAGGYGVFVRLMRDAGYDFRWTDAYCENLFARYFEEKLPLASQFEAITAFEVLEHIEEPMKLFKELSRLSSCLIVSTDLLPEPAPTPGEWWYYGTEHGQHISFYSLATLQRIALETGLFLNTDGVSFHVFTKDRLPPKLFNRIDSRLWCTLIPTLRRRESKSQSDHLVVSKLESARKPDGHKDDHSTEPDSPAFRTVEFR